MEELNMFDPPVSFRYVQTRRPCCYSPNMVSSVVGKMQYFCTLIWVFQHKSGLSLNSLWPCQSCLFTALAFISVAFLFSPCCRWIIRLQCVTAFRGGWHFQSSFSDGQECQCLISCLTVCQCGFFCHQMVGISCTLHIVLLSHIVQLLFFWGRCCWKVCPSCDLPPGHPIQCPPHSHPYCTLCCNVNCFLQDFLYEVVNSSMIYSLLTPSVCKLLLCVDSNESFFLRANGSFLHA